MTFFLIYLFNASSDLSLRHLAMLNEVKIMVTSASTK